MLARLRCNGRITTQWVSTPNVADSSTPKNDRDEEVDAVLVLQLVLDEHAGDRRRAEREVQHAGAAEDDDQAL